MSQNFYPFDLMPLPYSSDALEPYIDAETMQVHHNRLVKAYVEKLNGTLAPYPKLQKLSLEQMLRNVCAIPACIRTSIVHYGGGVYNHNFFFNALRPGITGNAPSGRLGNAIDHSFGSFDAFKKAFKQKAMAVFGSGWMWLVKDGRGKLLLEQTANQNTPLSLGHSPITVVDVWEHAYFLQYLNLRGEYIDNWFNVINWNRAGEIYNG